MKELLVVPQIDSFRTFKEFADEFELGPADLILTNEYLYDPLMKDADTGSSFIFQEKFGGGEPSDIMVDEILEQASKLDFNRVIAVGGGTVIDIAKILSLDEATDVDSLYDRDQLTRSRKLVILPTTCGTGSEVTNIAIVNRTRKGTKMGLVSPAMYADHAVLVPEFMKSLPWNVFATSSIDALIHAIESYLSPNATEFTELFSEAAIDKILRGYSRIAKDGRQVRSEDDEEYLKAAAGAGIAFGNAGCAAVHAISYAFGAKYHVPHGESNYQFLTEVLKEYRMKKPGGTIAELEKLILDTLVKYEFASEEESDGFAALEGLLSEILELKPMGAYGAVPEDPEDFAASTVANQQRLLKNNYVPLTEEEIEMIYKNRM